MIELSKTQESFMIKNTYMIDEILFGGGAGGGKSFALIEDSYMYAQPFTK